MISPHISKMTVDQLKARIRIHESSAVLFAKRREESMAQQFREMAQTYRTELGARESAEYGCQIPPAADRAAAEEWQ